MRCSISRVVPVEATVPRFVSSFIWWLSERLAWENAAVPWYVPDFIRGLLLRHHPRFQHGGYHGKIVLRLHLLVFRVADVGEKDTTLVVS